MKNLQRTLLATALLSITCACSSRHQQVAQTPAMQTEALPAHLQGCTWVSANAGKDKFAVFFKYGQKPVPLKDTMYLCCPGAENIDPKCYQAKWYTQ